MPEPLIDLSVDFSQVESLLGRLDEVDNKDTRRTIVEEEMDGLGALLADRLEVATPRGATGQLAASTGYRVLSGGGTVLLLVEQPARSIGGYAYRQVVAGGRRPGKPPSSTRLLAWVVVKLATPLESARRVAFLVARKIGRSGITPNPYTTNVVRSNLSEIETVAQRIGTRLAVIITNTRRRRI